MSVRCSVLLIAFMAMNAAGERFAYKGALEVSKAEIKRSNEGEAIEQGHGGKTPEEVLCSKNVTAADHDTLGSCAYFHCDAKRRGLGVMCEPTKHDCICALGWCAVGTEGQVKSDKSTGKCVPCDDLDNSTTKFNLKLAVKYDATPDAKKVHAEIANELLKYGVTASERTKAKAKKVSKAVGTCDMFHCSASRAPDQPNGGGVGCNPLDGKCYCLAENYFAYGAKFNRAKKGEMTPSFMGDSHSAACVHIDQIPAL